jgi:hypothetical protein
MKRVHRVFEELKIIGTPSYLQRKVISKKLCLSSKHPYLQCFSADYYQHALSPDMAMFRGPHVRRI